MPYSFDDRRYYPTNASGNWEMTPAMTGDFRTARLRDYLESTAMNQEREQSMGNEAAQIKDRLNALLADNGTQTPERDLSFMGWIKELASNLDRGDVFGLPEYLLKQIDKITGRRQGPGPMASPEEVTSWVLNNPDQFMGFAGASAPINFAKMSGLAGKIGPAARRGGEGWAEQISKNNPLMKTLSDLESGKWGTGESNAVDRGFGIKKPQNMRKTQQDIISKKPPSDFDKWDAYDIVTNLDLPTDYMDSARMMLSSEPKIAYRIAADPSLQSAIKADPEVMSRMAQANSAWDIGTRAQNPEFYRNAYARSTGRAQQGEPDIRWKGGYAYEDADLSKAGWALPPDSVPHNWQSRLGTPLGELLSELPSGGKVLSTAQSALEGGVKGLRGIGQGLSNAGAEMASNVWKAIPPNSQTRLDDFLENHGWILPTAGLSGMALALKQLIPALPSTELTPSMYDKDPNYVPRDINDPEGLLTSRRRQEQMIGKMGDSPWKVASEIFPWNW